MPNGDLAPDLKKEEGKRGKNLEEKPRSNSSSVRRGVPDLPCPPQHVLYRYSIPIGSLKVRFKAILHSIKGHA